MITFKEIRPGYTLHVLDRKDTRYTEAEVTETGAPRVRTVTEMAGGLGMVEDITVRDGETVRTFTVGIDDTHASGGDFFIATDRDSIANELKATRRTSEDAIYAVKKHQETVDRCTEILEALDPQYGNAAETDREVKALRNEIAELKELMMRQLEKGGQE